MTGFDLAAATASLRDFQRATVCHVTDEFYGPADRKRFLVADETGLGKSLVARGVVAEAIENLLTDDRIDRIDVVYVCSSVELARQNLRRLDVLDQLDSRRHQADRLTMLALHGSSLWEPTPGLPKPVNLIAFTPGTSFEHGTNLGTARERALLAVILRNELQLDRPQWRRLRIVLRGNAPKSFDRRIADVEWVLEDVGGADDKIIDEFLQSIRSSGELLAVQQLVDEVGLRRSLDAGQQDRAKHLIGSMRRQLASAAVESLEPDLIILDEFQRFRHLLDPENGPAAELAHDLFGYRDAKVLLLSATPYKPFTFAEEAELGDDHHRDFMATIEFLADGSEIDLHAIAADLSAFRENVIAGRSVAEFVDRLSSELRHLMCRTERPRTGDDDMVEERRSRIDDVAPADLLEYVHLRRLADEVGAPFNVEYWKSAPYFANFMDGYRLGQASKDACATEPADGVVSELLRQTTHLTAADIDSGISVDPVNGRFRKLLADTVGRNMHRLPWLAPSLPYLQPAGPWADPVLAGVTKRLVFSAWSATPNAIATLLSYEAERRMTGGRQIEARLQYRMQGERQSDMNTLAIFWPHPDLARLTDPFEIASTRSAQLSTGDAHGFAAALVAEAWGRAADAGPTTEPLWRSYFARKSAPNGLAAPDMVAALAGRYGDPDSTAAEDVGLTAHLEHALSIANEGGVPGEEADVLAEVGLYSPANTAYRAIERLLGPLDAVGASTVWCGAAIIADGLRTLFNRGDIQAMIDVEYGTAVPYWRTVLKVCADGNLQSLLDEYLHHVRNDQFSGRLDDDRVIELAQTVRKAMALRPAQYQLFDPSNPSEPIRIGSRFALRYGSRAGTMKDNDSIRLPEVRRAFNSPFWPFVLATTSVGQEGIDFHWWCHSVLHWNTPPSPVDFEQREGRVHRYGGHAIRRNVAAAHGDLALRSSGRHPWDTLWDLARDHQHVHGELSPHWLYPGPFAVERHVMPFALSADLGRLDRLQRDVALYRLAFGQSRQEDLLETLATRGGGSAPVDLDECRIDLRPDPSVASVDS